MSDVPAVKDEDRAFSGRSRLLFQEDRPPERIVSGSGNGVFNRRVGFLAHPGDQEIGSLADDGPAIRTIVFIGFSQAEGDFRRAFPDFTRWVVHLAKPSPGRDNPSRRHRLFRRKASPADPGQDVFNLVFHIRIVTEGFPRRQYREMKPRPAFSGRLPPFASPEAPPAAFFF
jgi:hypothetical protein